MKGKLKSVIIFAVAISGVIGWKFYNKSQASSETKEQVRALLVALPEYPAHADYFNELLDRSHEDAFSAAYQMGGRRRGASFDAEKYLQVVFANMVEHARADGRADLVAALTSGAHGEVAPASETESTPVEGSSTSRS